MNVTLRQLQVFRAVAAGRNFSRAGDEIGLTQSAVSRSVVELETAMGLKLLDRTTREVVLTEAGQALAARVDRVLEEIEQMLQEVAGLARSMRGTVRVASSPTLSASLMPACLAACAQREPGLRLLMLDRIQQDVLASVRSGEVAWRALSGQPLVLLDHGSGSRRLIDAALARHRARCPVAQELGHPTTVFRMVEAGIGISVMPALAMPASEVPGLVQRPLRPLVDRDVVLVHRRNRTPSPLAQRAWALVREVSASLAR